MEDNVVDEHLSSGAVSSSESADEMVETLIQGRAKRATAGRHMSALLNAEADDDLALLFEEVEDDNEFAVAEEVGDQEDDMRLDSSSDDDEDAAAHNDELEGERELEAQEKAARKKRKAADPLSFPALKKKRVKIDPTAVTPATAPRSKKKSERLSWLPTPDEGPTRSSSRRQTMQNKELTHARLKDSERKRVKLLANMEKAAKRKALLKPKEMTQAEHLAEAERVERLNSKSLNRWEEAEKKKAEERLAKIEALQNRRLHGPVMSYWSGIATWVDGVLKRVGNVEVTSKPDKEEPIKKKSKKGDSDGSAVLDPKLTTTAGSDHPSFSISVPAAPTSGDGKPLSTDTDVQMTDQTMEKPEGAPATGASSLLHPDQAASGVSESLTQVGDSSSTAHGPGITTPANSNGEPLPEPAMAVDKTSPTGGTINSHTNDEIRTATKAQEPARPEPASNQGPSSDGAGPATVVSTTTKSSSPEIKRSPSFSIVVPPPSRDRKKMKESRHEMAVAAPKDGSEKSPTPMTATQNGSPNGVHVQVPARPSQKSLSSSPVPADASYTGDHQATTAGETSLGHFDGATTQPNGPTGPPKVEKTGRNLTILENFDERTAQSREFNIYFNAKKPPRLTKISSSLCVITSLPSRYRDPDTGLPFANAHAYREIQHAAAQKYAWSPMLGCYVGPLGIAARGVPERFLNPLAPPPPPAAPLTSATKTTDPAREKTEGAGRETGPSKEGEKKSISGDTVTMSPHVSAGPLETRTEDLATTGTASGPTLPAVTPSTKATAPVVGSGPGDATVDSGKG